MEWTQYLGNCFLCIHECGGSCDRVGGENNSTPLGKTKGACQAPPEAVVPTPWSVPVTPAPLHPPISMLLTLTSLPSGFRHMLADRLSKGEEVGTVQSVSIYQGSRVWALLQEGQGDSLFGVHTWGQLLATASWKESMAGKAPA